MEGGIARQGGGKDAATRHRARDGPSGELRLEREAQGTGSAIGNGWTGGVFGCVYFGSFRCRVITTNSSGTNMGSRRLHEVRRPGMAFVR